jgi:septation ring formation regulator EzrA
MPPPFYAGDYMGAKSALVAGLCLALSGTTINAVSGAAAPAGQIQNINPEVTRRFNQLQQIEENDRMRRQNVEEAQKLVSLAAELKQYSEAMELGGLPPQAVRKAGEAEKLARRIHGRLTERARRIRPH